MTLVFVLLDFLSPAHSGGLFQFIMLFFAFVGVFVGYVSAQLYNVFNGDDWRMATFLAAFRYPGIVCEIFFVLNLLIWRQKSSGAVLFTITSAWLALQVIRDGPSIAPGTPTSGADA